MEADIYIERGGRAVGAFLRELAIRLTLKPDCRYDESDRLYYLGAGYWRARPVPAAPDGEPGRFDGVVLINSDYTREELAAIAAALRVFFR